MTQKTPSIFKKSSDLAILTVISRILGLVRESVTAALLGTGVLADAFSVAFIVPDMVRRLFADGVMSAAFIPQFKGLVTENKRERAAEFLNAVFSIVTVSAFVAVVILMVFSGNLVSVLSPSFDAESAEEAAFLAKIMFPYIFFITLAALIQSVLNSSGIFRPSGTSPIVFNITFITLAFLLAPLSSDPARALSIGVLAGGFEALIHQLIALGMCQRHVSAVAGQQHDEALGHGEGLGIAGGVGPGDGDFLSGEAVLAELLADPHQVGQRLRGMVDVALQVHDGDFAGVLRIGQILVDAGLDLGLEDVALAQNLVVTNAHGVAVHAQHGAGFLGGLAVIHLGGGAIDDDGHHAEACGSAGPGRLGAGAVVEEHGVGHLVGQQRLQLALLVQGLELLSDRQERLDFGGAPVGGEEQALAVETLQNLLVELHALGGGLLGRGCFLGGRGLHSCLLGGDFHGGLDGCFLHCGLFGCSHGWRFLFGMRVYGW